MLKLQKERFGNAGIYPETPVLARFNDVSVAIFDKARDIDPDKPMLSLKFKILTCFKKVKSGSGPVNEFPEKSRANILVDKANDGIDPES